MSSPVPGEVSEASRCVSCDAPLTGRFCAVCGEEVREKTRYGLGVFLGRAVGHLLATDSRLLRSFRVLFTRPGALTEAYFRGRRRPYLEPMQVFLLANLVYFVLAGTLGVRSFNTSLGAHMVSSNFYHQPLAERWVNDRVTSRGVSLDAYREVFDRRVNTLAKTLILVMIPALALILQLLERRRFFVEHLVFSAHFYAALLLLFLAFMALVLLLGSILPIAELPRGSFGRSFWRLFTESAPAIPAAIYLGLASRRFYGGSLRRAVVTGLVLTAAVYQIVLLYRAGLFFVTFWLT